MLDRTTNAQAGVIQDLVDFYLRWPEFRPMAQQLMRRRGLPQTQRDTLRWLIELADRVSEQDID